MPLLSLCLVLSISSLALFFILFISLSLYSIRIHRKERGEPPNFNQRKTKGIGKKEKEEVEKQKTWQFQGFLWAYLLSLLLFAPFFCPWLVHNPPLLLLRPQAMVGNHFFFFGYSSYFNHILDKLYINKISIRFFLLFFWSWGFLNIRYPNLNQKKRY